MSEKPAWRIYYGDGSTYSDLDGPVENAPGWGVQIIRYRQKCGTPATVASCDCYCWQDGQWWNRDHFSAHRWLAGPGWKKIVFGEVIDTPDYQRIKDAAIRDPDFKP